MNRFLFSLLSSAFFLGACDSPELDSLKVPALPASALSDSAGPAVAAPLAETPPPVVEPTIPGSRYTTDSVGYTVGRLSATPVRRAAPTAADEFAVWQPLARQHLGQSLNVFRFDEGQLPLETAVIRSDEFDGYRRDEISYFVERGLRGRAFLYVPEAEGPQPAVIFWHGHTFGGFHSSAGIAPYERETNPHHAGAVALAEAGYVVLAPNVRTFGAGGGLDAHLHYDRIMGLAGATALGAFVSDGHRAVDVLTSLSEVDASRIGVTGLSLGGLLTLLNAALDERISVAVPQGFFGSYRESLIAAEGCACQFAGALGRDLDIADVAALVAPRPLRVVAGAADSEFPLESQQRAFDRAEHAFQLLSASDVIELSIHPGGHEWIAPNAIEFLDQHLRSNE